MGGTNICEHNAIGATRSVEGPPAAGDAMGARSVHQLQVNHVRTRAFAKGWNQLRARKRILAISL